MPALRRLQPSSNVLAGSISEMTLCFRVPSGADSLPVVAMVERLLDRLGRFLQLFLESQEILPDLLTRNPANMARREAIQGVIQTPAAKIPQVETHRIHPTRLELQVTAAT